MEALGEHGPSMEGIEVGGLRIELFHSYVIYQGTAPFKGARFPRGNRGLLLVLPPRIRHNASEWEVAMAPGVLTNYHTHCYLDDGSNKPEEYVRTAIASGMRALGFSCHAPLPFPQDWVLTKENLPVYIREVSGLKRQYADQIEIYLGLEVDYIPELAGPQSQSMRSLRLDYTIGSVHFVGGEENDIHLAVDGPPEEYLEAIQEGYGGDVKRLVRDYYRLVREMVAEQTPDIVGHLDVIKKNNPGGRYFDERDAWYRDEIMMTLESLAASGAILEMNTGGLARKRTDAPYPSPWIVSEARRYGIPMNVNSDAHSPEHLVHWFGEAKELLKSAGYREQLVLLGGKWQMTEL